MDTDQFDSIVHYHYTETTEQFEYMAGTNENIISLDWDNPHCHQGLEYFEVTYLHYVQEYDIHIR